MVISSNKKISTKDYLELERASEHRHEYYFGTIFQMNSESKTAIKINNNFVSKWDSVLEKQKLILYNISIKTETKVDTIFRYPDIVITDENDSDDDYLVKKPIIIVEIANTTSWKTDFFIKKAEYSKIPSLKYYLIVAQEETFVELCIRKGSDWTFVHFEELDETIELADFNLKIALSEIYHRVKFADSKTDS